MSRPKKALQPKHPVALFSLDFRTRVLSEDGGDSHVAKYEGALTVFLEDELDEDEHPAGTLRLFVVNVSGALAEGYSLFDLLDREADSAQYLSILDPEGPYGFAEQVYSALIDESGALKDLLILDYIEIDPRYRGQGLALRVTRSLMRRFGRACQCAVLKTFPMQFKEDLSNSPDELRAHRDRQFHAAERRLRHYYAKVGFKSLRGTDEEAWSDPRADEPPEGTEVREPAYARVKDEAVESLRSQDDRGKVHECRRVPFS